MNLQVSMPINNLVDAACIALHLLGQGARAVAFATSIVACANNLAEIYRIVSSKALDQGEAQPGPGQGTSIPLGPSNPPGDVKKGQCC